MRHQRNVRIMRREFISLGALVGTVCFAAQHVNAVPGQVLDEQKISNKAGGMEGELFSEDRFGDGIAPLGDLNGDGVPDIAVGAPRTFQAGYPGAVWILFMNTDGTINSKQKISAGVGGLEGETLSSNDQFGQSVTNLGDMDGDGVIDLAVGAPGDDGEAFKDFDFGAMWIVFLNPDGTVKDEQKINQNQGGFQGGPIFSFGFSAAALGDVDGDGVPDVAVSGGGVWVLLLNADGTVKEEQHLESVSSNITGIGDFNGDGVGDLASVNTVENSLHLVFLTSEGTIDNQIVITEITTEIGTPSAIGDLDNNNVVDLALVASAPQQPQGFTAVLILLLNADGSIKNQQLIGEGVGGFEGSLDFSDCFGCGLASPGDLDGDGVIDLAVGAPRDDDGGDDAGAVWMLFLNGLQGDVTNDNTVNVSDLLALLSAWGTCDNIANCPADLNGDGVVDVDDLITFLEHWS